MTTRRRFTDKFKATVALEALRGDRTTQEIAAKHKIHPTQVMVWKRQAIDGLTANAPQNRPCHEIRGSPRGNMIIRDVIFNLSI